MAKKLQRHTCKYIHATDLVPPEWRGWFWEAFSANAPFSWGDNHHSLITATEFADHAEGLGASIGLPDYPAFLKRVVALGQTYIDLEN